MMSYMISSSHGPSTESTNTSHYAYIFEIADLRAQLDEHRRMETGLHAQLDKLERNKTEMGSRLQHQTEDMAEM